MGQAVPVDDLPSGIAVPEDDLPDSVQNRPSQTAGPARSASPAQLPANPINDFVAGAFRRGVTGAAGGIAGGLHGLWDLAMGRGVDRAVEDIGATQQAVRSFGTPESAAGRTGAATTESGWNPLNWPGVALSWTGKKLGGIGESLGAPPAVSAALETAPTAMALLGPMVRSMKPYEVEAENGAPPGGPQSLSSAAVGGGASGGPEPLGAPVEGGLPEATHASRAQILSDVGIQKARESAIQGDAKSAAVDYQMTKYDQPAGRAAATQFQAERDALAGHAEKMIGDAGGTVGMDEDSVANRGATIAQPFDRLRQWFSDRTKQLYAEADQRAAAGRGTSYDPRTGATSLTNLESVDRVLDDPSFQNTLAAKNQQGLVNAARNQLQLFRKNNPGGFMASGAEQYRQWLNQVWSPDNKWAIGQLKDAVDNDVFSAAGEDVYAQARAIRTLRRQTLEDPQGISQLFDVDPNVSINRSTALEKIPDRLTQLPNEQFANVLKTLRDMPDELQPDAQAAIGEIKSHLLNKILQAGTQTSRGVGAQIWGTDRVAQVLRTHAGKFRLAFEGDPEAQAGIENLSNAGQILRVDPSYPGADAQAANAMKRGLVSRTLGHLGGSAGAAAGAAIGGPLGAAAGGAVGESVGLSAGARASERAALRGWNKRVRTTEPKP